MLLSIDQNKIAEQLAKEQPLYVVTPCNLEMPSISYEAPSSDVQSVVTAMPPELERARDRLQALRQSLKPMSDEDLERKIDQTRGR
jgi:hypothetical protein